MSRVLFLSKFALDVGVSGGTIRTTRLLDALRTRFDVEVLGFGDAGERAPRSRVSSALTGMLNGATPLFVAVVASLVARRLPTRSIVIGLAVGFTGAIIMGLPGWASSSATRSGILMIVAALMSYGVALNIARPLQQPIARFGRLWLPG